LGQHEPTVFYRHYRAASCDFLRTSACVGFCVALGHKTAYSSEKHRLFSILLGEFSSQAAAPSIVDQALPAALSGADHWLVMRRAGSQRWP
jgi:hypothetical protein